MGPDTLSTLLGALYKRRLTVVLVMAGAVLGGWFFVSSAPELWMARASTFVPLEVPRLSLSSEDANIPDGPVLPDSNETTRIGLVGVMSSPAVYERVAERVPDIDLRDLRRQVIVDVDVNQHLGVIVTHASKDMAVQLANEFILAFRDVLRDMAERAPRATLATLEAEQPGAWESYQSAQDDLVAYLDSIDSPDPEVDLKLLIDERSKIHDRLDELTIEELRGNAQRPVIEAQLQERDAFVLTRRTLVQNSNYRTALNEVSSLRVDLAVARLKYTAEYPEVRRMVERLAAAEQRVRDEAEQALVLGSEEYREDARTRSLMDQLVDFELADAGRQATRNVLEARQQTLESALERIPLNRAELSRLNTEIRRAQQHAERVSKRVEELRLQLRRGLDFTFVDETRMARIDDTRALPGLAGVVTFSALAGLVVGMLLALLLEFVSQARMRRPF